MQKIQPVLASVGVKGSKGTGVECVVQESDKIKVLFYFHLTKAISSIIRSICKSVSHIMT